MAITAIKDLSQADTDAYCGKISYNTVEFNSLRTFSLRSEDVYDEAGRAVAYTRYTLTVRAFIFTSVNEATQAASMSSARRLLNQPGKELRLVDWGLGNIILNAASANTHTDLEWGPKPQTVEFTPVGLQLCEILWTCTFAIKECPGSTGNLVEFNYGVDWSIDYAGRTVRTIAGHLLIRLHRQVGTNSIATSANAYRHTIRVAVPVGFRRDDRSFHLSPDKARLDFSFVDRQLEGFAYPPGIVRADISYDFDSKNIGFEQWTATLAGSLEVAANVNPAAAANAFVIILTDKIKKLKELADNGSTIIPQQISFGHRLFSRESRFAVSMLVTHCLDKILTKGGIWEPIAGTSYAKWAESMAQAWDNAGTAGLGFLPAEDTIIDLCQAPSTLSIGLTPASDKRNGKASDGIFKPEVPPDGGWLFYKNALTVIREQQQTTHAYATGFAPSSVIIEVKKGVNLGSPGAKSEQGQYAGPPSELVLMQGKSMRVGHEPAVPRLKKIAGRDVEELKLVVDGPQAIACFFGSVVYTLRWAILYRVPSGYVTTVDPQKNPALCCDKQSAKKG